MNIKGRTYSVYLNEQLSDALDEYLEAEGLHASEVIRELVKSLLRQQE